MNIITTNRARAALALVAAALLGVALIALLSARSEAAPSGPVAEVSTAQSRAFAALRKTPAIGVPESLRTWDVLSTAAHENGANVSLARAISPPNADTGAIYLIPARDAVCIYVDSPDGNPDNAAAGCQAMSQVQRTGGVYLQLIPPNDASKTSPLPPEGASFRSRIVGVATAGVVGVSTTRENGVKTSARVSGDGAFALSGTDLKGLSFASSAGAAVASAPLLHR